VPNVGAGIRVESAHEETSCSTQISDHCEFLTGQATTPVLISGPSDDSRTLIHERPPMDELFFIASSELVLGDHPQAAKECMNIRQVARSLFGNRKSNMMRSSWFQVRSG
jgi:hypothetical protein